MAWRQAGALPPASWRCLLVALSPDLDLVPCAGRLQEGERQSKSLASLHAVELGRAPLADRRHYVLDVRVVAARHPGVKGRARSGRVVGGLDALLLGQLGLRALAPDPPGHRPMVADHDT